MKGGVLWPLAGRRVRGGARTIGRHSGRSACGPAAARAGAIRGRRGWSVRGRGRTAYHFRVRSTLASPEVFAPEEAAALAPYFGNTDRPVFVLTNLPEAVRGALFARYSRSPKSARRLFLDEFLDDVRAGAEAAGSGPGRDRARRLYDRVLKGYGDDSVAQLGGAHVACEGVSNLLTKVLERGRLMSYLEQSTRYVPYTDRPGGRWKYVVPGEIEDASDRRAFEETLDRAFETYSRWLGPMQRYYRKRYPRSARDSEAAYGSVIRSKALDTLRGLLPAATRSNVGIYGSGQAYEMLLLRMRAHPLAEAHEVAGLMLAELRRVIPEFVQRVDLPDRGGVWKDYLQGCARGTRALAEETIGGDDGAESGSGVTLSDFQPDGEIKVVAAALYAASDLPLDRLLAVAGSMTPDDRLRVLRTYVGERLNRRHRPGRAFEHASYTFDVVSDYGAFRDLQRHRMLTLDWQGLTTRHGCERPPEVAEAGALDDWTRVMDESAALHERLARNYSSSVAQYAVAMAYRIRFYMRMNAREAMHVIELRTSPQGHAAYRRICREMWKLIDGKAGHAAIAGAMSFVKRSGVRLERLEAERANEFAQGRLQLEQD